MMKKLIKHEFSNSWLEITIICLSFIIISAITSFFIRISESYFIGLLIVAMVFLYIFALVVVLINVIRSFNSKIFGSEGYLTLTLPISIDKLLLSKIIVNFIWMITVSATLVIGIGLISMIVGELKLSTFFYFIDSIFQNFWGFAFSVLAILIQALFALILLIFVLSILNIGKIKKFKFLIGLILYYFISLVFNWLGNLALIIPYRMTISNDLIVFEQIHYGTNMLFGPLLGGIYLNIILWNSVGIIGFYLLSRFIIKNFVELE